MVFSNFTTLLTRRSRFERAVFWRTGKDALQWIVDRVFVL